MRSHSAGTLIRPLIVAAVLAGFVLPEPSFPMARSRGSNDPVQQGDAGFKSGRGNGRLGGRVTDLEGNALAGIEVRLVFSQIDDLIYKDKSSKKGDFAFAGLGSGYWNLTVFGPGYEIYTASINVSQVSANPPVRVRLQKSAASSAGLAGDTASQADLDKGRQLLDERKFAEALPFLEAFLAKNPSIMGARLLVGDCRRELGRLDEAETDYGAVLDSAKTDPDLAAELAPRARLGLGDIKLKQGKEAEASEHFREAVRISPRDEALAYSVGEICYAAKRYDEAVRYFLAAEQLKPDWPDPILKLGYVYLAKNEIPGAIAKFEKFLAMERQGERAASVKAILESIRK